MAIGYACIAMGINDGGMRGCVLKNANPSRLDLLTATNLSTLGKQLDYNIRNGINLFRISSDIIPFGSHPVNRNLWWEDHADSLQMLGDKIKSSGMRVSMHPGQYTVLNASDPKVLKNAVADLEYHARFLDALGINTQHKIILHLGGIYGDWQRSIARFEENFQRLSLGVRRRMVIENDEKYDIAKVMEVARELKIPAVFDVFHHQCHPAPGDRDVYYWVEQCRNTWQNDDGVQKIHYSQQEPGLRSGAHARSIKLQPFLDFYYQLPENPLDIMLEVKDKDISALKCILALQPDPPHRLGEPEKSI